MKSVIKSAVFLILLIALMVILKNPAFTNEMAMEQMTNSNTAYYHPITFDWVKTIVGILAVVAMGNFTIKVRKYFKENYDDED
jgi:hypothetical protein